MVPEQLRFECVSGDKSPWKDESVGPDGTESLGQGKDLRPLFSVPVAPLYMATRGQYPFRVGQENCDGNSPGPHSFL